jgi:hypothetical protein
MREITLINPATAAASPVTATISDVISERIPLSIDSAPSSPAVD